VAEIIGSCTLLITCLQKKAEKQRYRIQEDPPPPTFTLHTTSCTIARILPTSQKGEIYGMI